MTYRELLDKFQADVEKLREDCKHEKASGWIEEFWAPGHGSGGKVKVCSICDMVVERKGVKAGYTITATDQPDRTISAESFHETFYGDDRDTKGE